MCHISIQKSRHNRIFLVTKLRLKLETFPTLCRGERHWAKRGFVTSAQPQEVKEIPGILRQKGS
jgi:hypothetical protein